MIVGADTTEQLAADTTEQLATSTKLTADNDMPMCWTGQSILRFFKHDENEPQTKEHDTENKIMEER